MLSEFTDQEILDEYRLRVNSLREDKAKINSACKASLKLIEHFKTLDDSRESFVIMYLTTQNELIAIETLFTGTINSSAVYPREIIKAVLANNAQCVILAHNHPSGETSPSNSDRAVTAKIKTALDSIDVNLLDHVIIGSGTLETYSFTDHNLL